MSDTDNPNPAHGTRPFVDSGTAADGFTRSPRFHGVHTDQSTGTVTHVARVPGGGGLTGWNQPDQ